MTRRRMLAVSALSMLTASALASDAETSATAGSSRYARDGTASATARYEGLLGFARTDSKSGPISAARGVAVGFDQSGLSLSVSNAIAPRFGPAVGASFNLSIDRDGRLSRSRGLVLSDGPLHRSATVGGRVGTGRQGSTPIALASGTSDRFGRVRAATSAQEYRPARVMRVGQRYPDEVRRYRSFRH